MTFTYTDPDGNELIVYRAVGLPELYLGMSGVCAVPLDRVEEVIAGIRDTARQAATAAAATATHTGGNAEDCPACYGSNPAYPWICPGSATEAAS